MERRTKRILNLGVTTSIDEAIGGNDVLSDGVGPKSAVFREGKEKLVWNLQPRTKRIPTLC